MRTLLLTLCLVSSFISDVAASETLCAEREQLVDQLVSEFGEHLAMVKDVKGEGLLEIHVSADSGTWTALLTKSWDLSCVVADGEDAPVPDILEVNPEV